MKRTDLNIAQRIWLEILWRMARLFAAMPYWFKFHVVENLLFFVLCYCLRYRMQVVRRNLRNSFPEKSDEELAAIRRRFYRTLAELIVDTIDLARLTPDKGRSILQVEGLEEHLRKVGGRDWIAMTAHFGCWEYCSFWGFYAPTQIVVAVYHPLRSKVAEALYQRLRNGDYATTVSMKESLRFYLRNRTGVRRQEPRDGAHRRPESSAAARQPLVPLPQSGYDLLSTVARSSRCAATYPSTSCDEPLAAGTLRNVLRAALRRRGAGRAQRDHRTLCPRAGAGDPRTARTLDVVASPLEAQTNHAER